MYLYIYFHGKEQYKHNTPPEVQYVIILSCLVKDLVPYLAR